MSPIRKIPVAEVELSVICTNRCRAQFGQDVTLDTVAAKSDDELKTAGFRRRDIRQIREAASNLVTVDESVLPPPHWTPDDRYDRHPKRPEDWDWRNDPGMPERLEMAVRRLNFASDLADPRAPDQMTLVLRRDLLDLKHSWLRLQAWFDLTMSRSDEIAGLHRQRDELHETTNRYLEPGRKARRALALALDFLSEFEPGDSRAVSDEYVAMLAVLCGVEPNSPGEEMAIIEAAIDRRNPPQSAGE